MVKVAIGVPTSGMCRNDAFYDYFDMMQKPEGTMVMRVHASSPARNRNLIIENAMQQNATHILFLDDDMAIRPDLLMNLLAHDLDIVSGLYLMKNYPHFPVMFDKAYDDGKCLFSFMHHGRKGLTEVVNIGLGAVLIKMEVFKKMQAAGDDFMPWITLGQCEKDGWCDDIHFFNKCRKLGLKIFVDLEQPLGHFTQCCVFPNRKEDGSWVTTLTTDSVNAVEIPQSVPSVEEVTEKTKEYKEEVLESRA